MPSKDGILGKKEPNNAQAAPRPSIAPVPGELLDLQPSRYKLKPFQDANPTCNEPAGRSWAFSDLLVICSREKALINTSKDGGNKENMTQHLVSSWRR